MTQHHSLRLHWLDPKDPDQPFPPAEYALKEPDGLLAVGGDLSPKRLMRAYQAGIFPWFNPDEPILWWSPDPRCVFFPDALRVSHSLAKRIRQQGFALSFNGAFVDVVRACGGPRRAHRGTWLSKDMQAAYEGLHALGLAHSLEVWQQGALVGGLYGVSMGGVFFGESMFSTATDASKIALVTLAQQLRRWGFVMIDAQVVSPHLMSLGACTLPRADFLQLLQQGLQISAPQVWALDAELSGNPAHLPLTTAVPLVMP